MAIVMNIIGLVIWTVLTIFYFSNPKKYSLQNWLAGLIGVTIILTIYIPYFSKFFNK